jgi:VanZ family protein
MQNRLTPHKPASSNRILIVAAVGILFLTLYPFRLVPRSKSAEHNSPFFLEGLGKGAKPLDALLNVLLFVPLGFGLAEKLRGRGKPRAATVAQVLVVGALLSYGIEFLQIYIPGRDSRWEDVLTNSTGAAVGSLLFDAWGGAVLRLLSRIEAGLTAFLTWQRGAVILVIYFACWFAISGRLQKQTRLSNWDPNCLLTVGNEAAGHDWTAWQGDVFELQLWDRALPDALATALTAGIAPNDASAAPVAAYVFAGSPPFRDQTKFLPELSWRSVAPPPADPNKLVLDGKSWLASEVPASDLVARLQRTNQFAVRVVCGPGAAVGLSGRIVSLSRPSGLVDLNILQENANLVFWFRNPLSIRHASLAWYAPNVFAANQRRDILYSYDGTNLSLFIDGKKEPHVYRLGPGTALARLVTRVKPAELDEYADVYYAAVFFPAGVLLGIAARKLTSRNVAGWLSLAFCLLAPPWLLERWLTSESGRLFSLPYVVLSLVLVCGSALWIDMDRRRDARAQ